MALKWFTCIHFLLQLGSSMNFSQHSMSGANSGGDEAVQLQLFVAIVKRNAQFLSVEYDMHMNVVVEQNFEHNF